MSKKFALIGLAGYIAPKHLKAIKETGSTLLAALDKNDSVGVMDSYFPDASFFVEFERFDRHIEKLKREHRTQIDYLSICTPNYLHDAHIRMALRSGANAICEKPLVLNPWNIDALQAIEKETGKKIYTILQLRHHDSILKLKHQVDNASADKVFDVDLTYLTSRGKWYYASWKGDIAKSGGIATNIGVHFFDMLQWVFGELKENLVYEHEFDRASGYLVFEKARVKWFLSINYDLIPQEIKEKGQRTYRSITVDGQEVEFSKGFTDLHTVSYQSILDGNGFDIEDARASIEVVNEIRNADVVKPENKDEVHPLFYQPKAIHPFN